MAKAGNKQATASRSYSARDRLAGFVALARPIFFILTPVNAASAVVLALRGFPSWQECIIGFFAVALAGTSINIFNDYVDRQRDARIWPHRALPSGRVKPNEALLIVLIAAVISLLLAWFFFNPKTFYILLLAIALGMLYSSWLRDRVGYLALPPIIGLIYLGGWAAVAPETLLTNWLPWYLYGLGVLWQAGHIMVYYPLHLDEGAKAPPAFFFTPSAKVAVGIGLAFVLLTVIGGIALHFLAQLDLIYLLLVTFVGVYAIMGAYRLFGHPENRRLGIQAFMAASVLRMTISAAILLTFFIQLF